MHKSPGRGRAVILGCVAFVTSFGAHVVAVNLPVYARQVGIGLAMIGALIAVYDFAEVIAKPVFGLIADRAGLKRTMLLGIVVFCGASLLFLVVDPKLLIVIRFLQGVGAAALSILSAALIASYYGENRGEAYGIYNAIKGAGYVISPVVGGAIVWASSFRMIFVASFAAGAIAFLLSLRLPSPAVQSPLEDDDDLSPRQFLSVFTERALLPWYAIIVVNMFLVGILFGFLPVYVHSLGYDQLHNGLIVGAATLSYLLIQPFAGRMADRTDANRVVLVGLILSALGVLLIPFASGLLLVLIAIAGGLGVGAVWTNSDMMVSRLARQRQIGAALGAAGSFKEIGDMLGPLLIGVLAQTFGLKVAFVSCGVAGLASIALLRTARSRAV
ncbi:MAG TPA: MFS transporter [Thermoanaerobaculia bacterium]|nr:MFS transporter [Thermoanaerobaculia bacterium]